MTGSGNEEAENLAPGPGFTLSVRRADQNHRGGESKRRGGEDDHRGQPLRLPGGPRPARVLLLDLDPQANATSGLGLEKIEGASAYRPLLGEGDLREKIQGTAFAKTSK